MSYERPILISLLFLVAGCLVQHQLAIPFSNLVPVMFLTACCVALLLKKQILFVSMLALFWMAWGMAALAPRLDQNISKTGIARFDGKEIGIEGVVKNRPMFLPEGQRFELQVEHIIADEKALPVAGVVLITIASGQGTWLTGDRIRCVTKIRVPRLLGLPGEFDYPRYLALRGVNATAFIKDADSVVLMRGTAIPSLQRIPDQMALSSQQFIRQSLSNPGQRSVVLALATGSQQEISPDLATAYSRAGVSHILSVSGFHVGVVTIVWVFLLRWLMLRWEWLALRFDVRRIALISALPVMVLYLLFTGGAPATARSVLMLSAVVLAIWSERETDALDSLLAAAFLLLLFNPANLFDLSFQLSFFALWGLLVLTPLLAAPFERLIKQSWQRALLLFCSASLAATLATMIPVLASFHQASFTGIAANLVVVPLLGYGATVLATAAVPLIFLLPGLAGLLLQLAGWLVQFSNVFVIWIARMPVLHSFSIGSADILATVILLALISFVCSTRIKMLVSSVVLIGLTIVHFWPDLPDNRNLRMAFLSVGQGDSTLIRFPDGRTMLVDGGGYLKDNGKDFGERYLVPALHSLKVKRIDLMVLTHPHPDHLGGLPAVAEEFEVKEFWQGSEAGQGTEYQRLFRALNRQQTSIRVLKQGDQPLRAQNLVITVMSPPDKSDPKTGENDKSLVLHLNYGNFSTLMMGDAGFVVEEELLKQGIGKTTVLKVGHHGSKSASGELFLDRIKPEIAVFSAGYNNGFGLPAAVTVDKIRQRGIGFFRTDQQGSILIESDGTVFSAALLPRDSRLVTFARRFVLTGTHLLR